MTHVVFFVPSFASGGAEAFIVNTIERLDRDRFTSEIMAIKVAEDTVYADRLKEAGIRLRELVQDGNLNPITKYVKGYIEFWNLISSDEYGDATFHFNLAQGEDLPFVWLSKRAGAKTRIVHSHNSSANRWYKRVGHRVGKALFGASATQWLACSREAAKWLLPPRVYERGAYSIIKNGIPTELFRYDEKRRMAVRDELGIDPSTVLLLNVGRLEAQKNQQLLLDSFARMAVYDNDVVLAIVGEGSLRESLENRARSLGISSRVLWLGRRTDVPHLMSASDVFLLPSQFEGFPFVLVEAQASGLPCFVSEAISKECYLTDLVHACPLEADLLSECINNALKNDRGSSREDYWEKVGKMGYDISGSVHELEGLYE